MSYAAYPTGDDLSAFLIAANVMPDPPSGQLAKLKTTDKMLRAVARFESETGRTFLAQPATKVYDPPINLSGNLDLKGELIQLTSITVQGQLTVLNQDFYLLPNNNDQLNPPRPWTIVQFANYFPSPGWPYRPRSISVTGYWGFSLQVPNEIWGAMLSLGALLCYPELRLAISSGRDSYEISGALREAYLTTLVKEAAAWKLDYETARDDNKRLTGLL